MMTALKGTIHGNTVILDDDAKQFEGSTVIVTVLDMNTLSESTKAKHDVDVSKRIGVAKGIISYPEDFQKWDEEIIEMFDGDMI